ncbi:methyl-accepting chemotaxis protein [Glaciimonas sp. PAMC28666]|uniref:methyl-accepting chemotaxis protein n=1 Tax=Glaciimonas sp. PAMC28666 TaxID=2807626 RepID=UPI001963669F|nr:methyl-accepting chemotaxis protein [Glaciimonas sp. PAMC28666]QRX83177.1 MCP four helix bundle domain-containing protein [Glaciimonas sp. PAMC28666]
MNIRNLKISHKLMLAFGTLTLLPLILAAITYIRVGSLGGDIKLMNEDRYPKTVLAHRIKDRLNETAREMGEVLLMTDADATNKEFAEIEEDSRVITASIDKLDGMIITPQGREDLKALIEVRQRFTTLKATFIALAKQDKKDEAKTVLLKELRPAQLAYMKILDQLIEFQSGLMESAGTEVDAQANQTRMLVLTISLLAVAVSLLLGTLTTRSITRPLSDAVVIARRVAEGDLTSSIVVNSHEETGQMLQALKTMNDNLVKIVGEVRTGTDAIATASGQIASGNLDLSSRTEQQASSLEETAASMEELTGTVKQNAENARQANQLALSASEIAIKGGGVVSQVVDTMGSINKSARKIVDIISVIDGIAFQTNILALNAAVEAARAGEQGRGFAVVASEVRNLAQRSAAAAKEIKTLIDDSVQKVDVGVKLVDQAGATMGEIVESVKRVTDIMGEITAASQEQTSGIEQVNQAIMQMDQVTQQNAALVEEAAAAAASLQEQAGNLVQVVSVFKTDRRRATVSAPLRTVHRPVPAALRGTAAGSDARRPSTNAKPLKRAAIAAVTADGEWEKF